MKLARAIQEPETFGRVTVSGWERLGGAFYTDFRVAYDRNGGVLSETDELVRRKVTGGSWNGGWHRSLQSEIRASDRRLLRRSVLMHLPRRHAQRVPSALPMILIRGRATNQSRSLARGGSRDG
ncbi:MAG: hypothetical protein KF864_15495 [Phycisphaeraceae bacterium]|nr:hypothetical protein [Phycisphaeraceae bacterium]